MRIVNRDLTKESVHIYVCTHQIHAEIWSKSHGKWYKEYYFKDYTFEIDKELILSTCREIKRLWGLKNPKITVIKFM